MSLNTRNGMGVISPRVWAILSAIISIVLVVTGFIYYGAEKEKIRAEIYDWEEGVAGLKVREIEQWRLERLADVHVLSSDPLMRKSILRFIGDPHNKSLRSEVQQRLALEHRLELYSNAFVIDTTGRTLISVGGSSTRLDTSETAALHAVIAGRKAVLTDLFLGADGIVHIDAIDAVLGHSGKPVALVVLRSDASNFLYPLIESWPVPSRTAETLVLERRGNEVIFLSSPRFRHTSPFAMHIPLTSAMTPAVQAVLGKVGMFEGKDYRGKEVLADLRPIPNTPWFMVAKVDASEILAEANYRGGAVGLMVVLFIGLSVGATAYAYRHREAGIYRELYKSESERRGIEEEYKATLYSIGDGVITTDTEGAVKAVNHVAEELTGWKEAEAKGKRLEEVFRIVSETTGKAFQNPVDRVLRGGVIAGLADQTLLISKEGSRRPIADSAAPIRDESNKVVGVVLIFRDQTKEREVESLIRQSESRLARAEIVSKSGSWELHLNSQVMIVSKGAQEIYGVMGDRMSYEDVKSVPLIEYRQMMDDALKNHITNNEPYDIEYKIKAVDTGEIKDIHSVAVFDVEKNILLGVIQDITDRKRAEAALHESDEKFRLAFENSTIGMAIVGLDTRFLRLNKAVTEIFGYSEEEMIRMKFGEFTHPDDLNLSADLLAKLLLGEVKSIRFEKRYIKKGGQIIWVSLNSSIVMDMAGKPLYFVSLYEDITTQKEALESLRQSEQALRESQQMMKTVLDTVPVRVFWKDREGRYIGCNLPFALDSGLQSPEDVVGKDDFQMGWKEQAELYRADDRQVMESGKPKLGYEEPQTSGNATRWLRTSKVPLRNDAGEIIGILGSYEDITERKLAREALQKNEERLRITLEASNIGVWDWNLQEDKWVSTPLYFKMLGYDPDTESQNREVWGERFHPDDRESVIRKMETIRGKGENGFNIEFRFRHADGSYRWVNSIGKAVEWDKYGRVTRLVGVQIDITERKEAELALRESEEKFRALVEASASGIWIHNGRSFLYANPTALKITGYTLEELLRLDVLEIHPQELRSQLRERIGKRLKGEDVTSRFELQIIRKTGETIWANFSVALIQYQGQPAILVSVYDITDRKNIEEQLVQSQKMEGVGRLAGGVAHDYNNMLGIIIGYTELITQRLKKDDPIARYVELIGSASRRGADLTRQLLAFARREIVSPKPIDPNAAIGLLQNMLGKLIGEDVAIRFLPGKDVWKIKIDPTQFDQILVNLSTNARDAISGVGTIIIETSNVVVSEIYTQNKVGFAPGEYVLISYSDNGKGMNKETVDKIFEPFFTTKPRGQGTGLGLSTVFGIIKQNGGSINVYSEEGQGTTFNIYLPRYQGEVEEPEIKTETSVISGTETVLVVEDQSELLELAKNSLEEYGYTVLTALTPGEGILICEAYQDEIHLLLTDVVMPVMNGKDLRDRIQSIKPNIKTLFMSGYTANLIAHRGVLDEDVEFIQKPFTPHALAKKVHDVLNS
ncbi:MAG: PAS domain S-box protein [Bacteroidetes bacterium]|nr:PAS domain S-box protein [Bacteroidota bacterium]